MGPRNANKEKHVPGRHWLAVLEGGRRSTGLNRQVFVRKKKPRKLCDYVGGDKQDLRAVMKLRHKTWAAFRYLRSCDAQNVQESLLAEISYA